MFATRTLRGHVQEALGAERLTASLVSACGLLALLLAVVGLYGAIAYLVSRRTREIGVRIALGATPDRVIRLVVGQGLWIAGAGIAAGLACGPRQSYATFPDHLVEVDTAVFRRDGVEGRAPLFGIENLAVESGQPAIVNFWDPHEHPSNIYASRRC